MRVVRLPKIAPAFAALFALSGCNGLATPATIQAITVDPHNTGLVAPSPTPSASPSPSLSQQLTTQLQSLSPQGPAAFKQPDSTDYASIPQDPANPLNAAKVQLGQYLFHETGIGLNGVKPQSVKTFSCASCHNGAAGFQSNLPQGIADGGSGEANHGASRAMWSIFANYEVDVDGIRTPSTLNVAYQTNIMWDGRMGSTGVNVGTQAQWTTADTLNNNLGYLGAETQAIAAQNDHHMQIQGSIAVTDPTYQALYQQAFPGNLIGSLDQRTAGLAIAAYERTLLPNQSPFQQWLRGNTAAMTDAQLRGANLFFGKANCVSCHNGPALNSMDFHALGMNDFDPAKVFFYQVTDSLHLGRGGFTQNASDMYKFKVPQLYNLADSPYYGHGASFTSIREVVDYYNAGIPQNPAVPSSQIAPQFKPLGLSDSEASDLTEFLTSGLRDLGIARYIPTQVPSKLCFPSADPQSILDLGC